jgi:hypothetical protein
MGLPARSGVTSLQASLVCISFMLKNIF